MALFRLLLYLYICILYRNTLIECKIETSSDLGIDRSRSNPVFDIDFGDNHLVTINIKDRFSTENVIYEHDSTNDSHTFTPVKPYFIDKVVKNKDVLWDAADYDNEYGSQVYIGPGESGERLFRVYFPEDLIKHKPQIDIEVVDSTPKSKTVRVLPSPPPELEVVDSTPKSKTVRVLPSPPPELEVVDSTPKPKTVRVVPSHRPKIDKVEPIPQPKKQDQPDIKYDLSALLVVLNLKNRYNTDKYEYEYYQSSNTHRFTSIEPHMFGLVLSGNKLAWSPEVSEYPDTVIIHPGPNGKPIVSVYFPPEPYQGVPVSSDSEVEVDTPTPVPAEPLVQDVIVEPPVAKAAPMPMPKYTGSRLVSVDINYHQSTLVYNCFKYNNTVYFTPAFDYLINNVRETTSYGLIQSTHTIFQTTDPNHYSHMVELKHYVVIVHMVNGICRTYRKTSGSVWMMDREFTCELDKLDFDYRLVELDINKFKSTHIYDVKSFCTGDVDCRKYVYLSRREYKFRTIKEGTYVIWKAQEESECAHKVMILRHRFPDIKQAFLYLENGHVKIFVKNISAMFRETWKEHVCSHDKSLFRNYKRVGSRA